MSNRTRTIELIINGRKAASRARTVTELLVEQAFSDTKVATAVNGHFVPEARRATTMLEVGDRVEIVSARQGG